MKCLPAPNPVPVPNFGCTCYNSGMSLFAGFSAAAFWLLFSLFAAIIVFVIRRYVVEPWRGWLIPLYWLLIPYLALLTGAVSPRLMGLYWFDWRATFQIGAGLLLVIGLLALVVRLFAAPRAGLGAATGSGGSWPQQLRWVLLAGAEEWFWCFLRAALWEAALALPLNDLPPAYWSVWGAGLLAMPLLLAAQPSGPLRLVKVAILLVTSVVFLYTRNFWLCWLLHAALGLLFLPTVLAAQRVRLLPSQPQQG